MAKIVCTGMCPQMHFLDLQQLDRGLNGCEFNTHQVVEDCFSHLCMSSFTTSNNVGNGPKQLPLPTIDLTIGGHQGHLRLNHTFLQTQGPKLACCTLPLFIY